VAQPTGLTLRDPTKAVGAVPERCYAQLIGELFG